MSDIIRVPIFLGGQDTAHQLIEILTGQASLDFGAAAGAVGTTVTATATVPGLRVGMKLFVGASAQANSATFCILKSWAPGTDLLCASAINYSAAAAVAGATAYDVFAVRVS